MKNEAEIRPVRDDEGRVWCPLANGGAGEWREPTPTELLRQQAIMQLWWWGYAFTQMREGDFQELVLLWESENGKREGQPLLAFAYRPDETEAGEHFARTLGCRYYLTRHQQTLCCLDLETGLECPLPIKEKA